MFQNLITRMQEDDNPRLKRIPFMVIWVAAYGMAWIASFLGAMFASDLLDNFFFDDHIWLGGLLIGLIFGGMLALIQGWAMRRRYGFVPRFWRFATILGSAIGTSIFFTITANLYDDSSLWFAGLIWFACVTIFQSFVLFRVNHQAWLIATTGILAGLLAAIITATDNLWGSGNNVIVAILVGSAIQAIGTGIVMLRLLANPREGIVPKRESDEKAKIRLRQGLHPFTFIGFWASAYFMGWVTVMVCMVIWFMTIGETGFIENITGFISDNAEWVFGVTIGSIIGLTASLAQPWLMKQHSKTEVKHWIAFSTIGWAIAGIGLYAYMDNYNATDFERLTSLAVWFAVPALFQTIPMSRAMRGGWMWASTGIVTAIIAILIDTQFEWTYNAELYAVMIGGIAQAIITGTVFILLKSQQVQSEQNTELISA